MEVSQKAASSDRLRRTIAVALSVVIAVIFISTILSNEKILNTSASVTITAGMAMVASLIVVSKQKMDGLYGKTYLALAIGLTCWFAGELLWTYSTVIIGAVPTQLSVADALWLALYGFFGYYIFKTYQFFGKTVNKYHLVIVILGVSILMINTMYTILNSLEDNTQLATVLVRLSYPVGDAILIVPSVLLLITLRHGLLTYTPWLFISVALLLIAAADVLFSNMSLLAAFELSKIALPLYNAGNLILVGALVWYNRFGIYDKNKNLSAFQERNK